jgi:GTP-binding protein
MKFIDEVALTLISGHGGPGAVSFRREKSAEFGGPDGGDGGKGGSITFIADEGFNTLFHFRGKKVYRAENGGDGLNKMMNGKNGEELLLKVPVGTLVRDTETNELIADFTEHGQMITLCEGGIGGQGNINFKSSTNRTPTFAQSGRPGKELKLILELKLLADIAIIGQPNAGKSTLISVISSAKPKIADYPFTTLEPNLGVVSVGEKTIVVADIPGLIENASEGKGLGIKFLKHIERTSAFVHLVDVSWCLDGFEAFDQYVVVRQELEKYNPALMAKKEIICLTKIDAMTDEEIKKFVDFFEEQLDKKVLPLSAVAGKNVDALKNLMLKCLSRE